MSKDKDRLDWIDKHKAEIDWPEGDDGLYIVIYTPSNPLGSGKGMGLTLREAIDNAMRHKE